MGRHEFFQLGHGLVAQRLDLAMPRLGILATGHQAISQWSEVSKLCVEMHQTLP